MISGSFVYKRGEIRARPKSEKYINIAEKLNEYTESAEIPILAEFAYINNLTREYLYTLSEKDSALFNAIKRCTGKKEVVLELGALTGKYDKTMAIFSLKQLGWRDKIETESKVEFDSDGFMDALRGQVKETFADSGGIVEE